MELVLEDVRKLEKDMHMEKEVEHPINKLFLNSFGIASGIAEPLMDDGEVAGGEDGLEDNHMQLELKNVIMPKKTAITENDGKVIYYNDEEANGQIQTTNLT